MLIITSVVAIIAISYMLFKEVQLALSIDYIHTA